MLAVPLENRRQNQLNVAVEGRRQVSQHPQSVLQACAFTRSHWSVAVAAHPPPLSQPKPVRTTCQLYCVAANGEQRLNESGGIRRRATWQGRKRPCPALWHTEAGDVEVGEWNRWKWLRGGAASQIEPSNSRRTRHLGKLRASMDIAVGLIY